jgi:hypothetical protein
LLRGKRRSSSNPNKDLPVDFAGRRTHSAFRDVGF